jgi:hypothetical protein
MKGTWRVPFAFFNEKTSIARIRAPELTRGIVSSLCAITNLPAASRRSQEALKPILEL